MFFYLALLRTVPQNSPPGTTFFTGWTQTADFSREFSETEREKSKQRARQQAPNRPKTRVTSSHLT